MKALRLVDWKTDPELVEVPKPTPGPGEVIVRIGGAGACHSDLHVMHDFEPGMMPWKVPFTLGHENAGWVDSVGDGVTTVEEGDAVAVYGACGCGKCSRCQQGFENYCENPAEAPVPAGRSMSGCGSGGPTVRPAAGCGMGPRPSPPATRTTAAAGAHVHTCVAVGSSRCVDPVSSGGARQAWVMVRSEDRMLSRPSRAPGCLARTTRGRTRPG